MARVDDRAGMRPSVIERTHVVCFMCHRERPIAKMDGHRCDDRAACLKATFRAAPVHVSKTTLRKQYGNAPL